MSLKVLIDPEETFVANSASCSREQGTQRRPPIARIDHKREHGYDSRRNTPC
jgi:hypothetical protein